MLPDKLARWQDASRSSSAFVCVPVSGRRNRTSSTGQEADCSRCLQRPCAPGTLAGKRHCCFSAAGTKQDEISRQYFMCFERQCWCARCEGAPAQTQSWAPAGRWTALEHLATLELATAADVRCLESLPPRLRTLALYGRHWQSTLRPPPPPFSFTHPTVDSTTTATDACTATPAPGAPTASANNCRGNVP